MYPINNKLITESIFLNTALSNVIFLNIGDMTVTTCQRFSCKCLKVIETSTT